MRLELRGDAPAILDFDVEARPLAWYGGDWVTKEITAIAWRWVGRRPFNPWGVRYDRTGCVMLGEDTGYGEDWPTWDVPTMLEDFREVYDVADLVTGHYIRGFDLPLINGNLMEHKMPLLSDKMTHDTKLDMVRGSGLSKSQENLGAMLELHHPKVQMNVARWHAANRLTPEGIAMSRKRVTGDVKQHVELRKRMMELGMLGKPRLWTSSPSGGSKYAP